MKPVIAWIFIDWALSVSIFLHLAVGVDVDIDVYVGQNGGKLTFEYLFPFLHCSLKVLHGDRWVCGRNPTHPTFIASIFEQWLHE
jgi:hypothetical protein